VAGNDSKRGPLVYHRCVKRFALVASVAALVAAGSLGATRVVAAPRIKLQILQPAEGDVTGSTAEVRLQASGGRLSEIIQYDLTVDGRPVDSKTGRTTGTGAGRPFQVPGSAQARIQLHGLGIGVHVLRVVPVDEAQASGDEVAFAVGPQVSSRGPNLVGILIAAGLVALLVLYRNRILKPRMDRMEREAAGEENGPEHQPGTWGEDDWPEGLPPRGPEDEPPGP
jgi:hypothetical protein